MYEGFDMRLGISGSGFDRFWAFSVSGFGLNVVIFRGTGCPTEKFTSFLMERKFTAQNRIVVRCLI